MRLKGIFFILSTFLFLAIFSPKEIFASDKNQFITIVNPVRISFYTKNPKESIETQYNIISRNKLPATWLLTFDAIEDDRVLSIIKQMDKNQEIGIFLEVTPKFAKTANVVYHDTGFWHHATSVFLSGYTQSERVILIDKVFDEFKKRLGYYPTSVGSWWTDSYSLNYLKEKYKVSANLTVSDQFSTDGYQVWGQYWATPFYPSKYHTGIPASNLSVKLDIVNFQWAARDPLNGYNNSLYSTQDYQTINLNIDFFKKLIDLYARKHQNKFGQITLGLEGDFTSEAYKGEFTKQIELIKNLIESGEFKTTNMQDFADWYKAVFPDLSPPQKIESDDFLGKKIKTVWYQSPRYRLNYTENSETQEIKIRDLRVYSSKEKEPYYISPNKNNKLSINIPFIFDEVGSRENILKLPSGTKIDLTDNEIKIHSEVLEIPNILKYHPAVRITQQGKTYTLSFQDDWLTPLDGVVISDLTSEAVHFFKQKKAILYLIQGKGWNYFEKVPYLIPQGEIEALFYLSNLPYGVVLVYDKECLQCSWHTEYKPPAFANQKSYVKKFSKKPVIYNLRVFTAETRKEAKESLQKTKVRYIYLVKFEDYREEVPFSPGDLGIELVYSNANAEIWKVK